MSIQYEQNQNNNTLGDDIKNLPVDKTPPNNNEVYIVDTLFEKKKGILNTILEDSKDTLIVSILITVLCMPQISEIIQKIIPVTKKSEYFLYFAKGIIGGVLYWLIKYFYLSRK
tara:strand:+ start:4729 stop:5070 length:342 start_codon:yes stop_codon:yes gene_type:complete